MSLKMNINKIHSDLSSNFDNVEVSEKSSLEFGEYVELKAVSENKELVMIVTKRQLEGDKFNWSYYSNPKSLDFLVERSSTVDGLITDVKDIFEKNRFDSQYLESIKITNQEVYDNGEIEENTHSHKIDGIDFYDYVIYYKGKYYIIKVSDDGINTEVENPNDEALES